MARDGGAVVTDAGQQARRSVRQASPWLVGLGRFGHAAKGVVYILVGVLAVQVALGRGGETTDSTGALGRIAGAPFGKFLLLAMVIGIAGYALWRLLQAVLDTDDEGTDAEGILKRLGYAGSAIIYAGLALSAVQLLRTGDAGQSGGESARDQTAQLMSRPFGQWLVAIAGLVVIGIGGYQIYKGSKAKFKEDLKLGEIGATEERWVTRLGRVGHIARGIVFGLIGVFLIAAARQANPGEARGVDGALTALAERSFGPWLLGAVALGFVAYGVYMFAEARYRRMVVG